MDQSTIIIVVIAVILVIVLSVGIPMVCAPSASLTRSSTSESAQAMDGMTADQKRRLVVVIQNYINAENAKTSDAFVGFTSINTPTIEYLLTNLSCDQLTKPLKSVSDDISLKDQFKNSSIQDTLVLFLIIGHMFATAANKGQTIDDLFNSSDPNTNKILNILSNSNGQITVPVLAELEPLADSIGLGVELRNKRVFANFCR